MRIPVNKLKKEELVWLANHKCKKHGHDFLSHYMCYLRENPDKERIGHFDIEASNLDADYGIMLSYCILDDKTDKIYKGVITKKDLEKNLDKRLVQQCINDLLKFDIITGFYSTGFDFPFIRTRALIHNIKFPEYMSLKHKDVYYIAKSKLKLSSNRLENVSRVLFGESVKTRIDSKNWIGALRGDKKCLDYILDHNEKDVKELKRVYWKLINYTKETNKSI